MRPNGRRAWRAAAKKLRRKMGRRWRSPDAKWSDKRWSELVPNLEAHRGHITGAWFERHGITEQGLQTLDASHLVRVYVGLWGTVDGDYVTYDASPRPLTARSLVGMTQGARKRAAQAAGVARSTYRIGQRLRPCPGCHTCMPGVKGWHIDKVRGRFKVPTIAWSCDGSGVLPARAKKVRR